MHCVSIRGKNHPSERCSNKPIAGTEWCGKHKTVQIRFVPPALFPTTVSTSGPLTVSITGPTSTAAAGVIRNAWSRWLARRAGPLLWFRAECNNQCDFFSADPIEEIPLRDFVSFVDNGKGYGMDIKSAISLVSHAATTQEVAMNPFNRNVLSTTFVKRIERHANIKGWALLSPVSDLQKITLATTDVFRLIEDLGYYTDPSWFMDLTRQDLQRYYMELADIWFHRASLSVSDRARIVPGRSPFSVPVSTARIMQQKALRPLVLATCKLLVSASVLRSDRQLGVMYVIGALCLVSNASGSAYPWLVDQFSPGVTRIIGGEVVVLHNSVLGY